MLTKGLVFICFVPQGCCWVALCSVAVYQKHGYPGKRVPGVEISHSRVIHRRVRSILGCDMNIHTDDALLLLSARKRGYVFGQLKQYIYIYRYDASVALCREVQHQSTKWPYSSICYFVLQCITC